jgi:hypothetical protein
MTNLRRTLALVASLAAGALVVTTAPLSASARTVDHTADRTVDARCVGHGPIPASALARGTSAPACSLAGRVVTSGRVSVVVPPAGMSVAGEGTSAHGEPASLRVTNTGTTVRAVAGGSLGTPAGSGTSTSGRTTTAARASDPPACKDKTFHLEGHKWGRSLGYHINLGHMPKRYAKKVVIRQIKTGNGNMRHGRNSCGKSRLKTPRSHYLGRTRSKPNINPGSSSVKCGKPNSKNVVGFGSLPGGLLGWTCYWWYSTGRIGAADIMIDTGNLLRTHLPKNCTNSYDFEGVLTHEWGHAYGMGHTGPGHSHLTMQHRSHACSTFARTLGLGDWLGMKKMYGAR